MIFNKLLYRENTHTYIIRYLIDYVSEGYCQLMVLQHPHVPKHSPS